MAVNKTLQWVIRYAVWGPPALCPLSQCVLPRLVCSREFPRLAIRRIFSTQLNRCDSMIGYFGAAEKSVFTYGSRWKSAELGSVYRR